MILYCFDLKPGKTKNYNKLKRKFYYHYNKSALSTAKLRTKSVVSIPNSLESQADSFFKKWRGSILVYKIRPKSVCRLA